MIDLESLNTESYAKRGTLTKEWVEGVKAKYKINIYRTFEYPEDVILEGPILIGGGGFQPEITTKSTESSSTSINPIVPVLQYQALHIDNLSKYVDPYYGMTYILDEYDKTAYTLYDQYIIDAYIFDGLLDSIPLNTDVTINTIVRDYTVYAL